MTAAEVIALLIEKWPKAFCVYEKNRRPLKLRVDMEILAALGGVVSPGDLERALRFYTSNTVYLSKCRAGAPRVGLDGEQSGGVTPEEAARALRLWRRAVRRRAAKRAERERAEKEREENERAGRRALGHRPVLKLKTNVKLLVRS